MLAHSFAKHGHKIKYPCYAQRKYDGIRILAVIEDGVCTLWSRTRKPIYSLPHIVHELESMFPDQSIILDGEGYNHKFKTNFEHIVHLIRQEEPDEQCTDVQYHVYDVVAEGTFEERWGKFLDYTDMFDPEHVRVVGSERINTEDDVIKYFETCKEMGFEGAMLRNADGKYAHKRSYDLQKVKEFEDQEFDIVGIEEGRGKLSGHVGAFICKNESGTEFLAKMAGDTDMLKRYFEDHSLWRNKRLTVQFQGLTGRQKVPRFPVGLRIRENE